MKKIAGIISTTVAALVLAVLVWFLSASPQQQEVALLWLSPGKTPTRSPIPKPICSQVVVPTGDCIPQHMANLPPDPGPAGKLTIDGIDSDKDPDGLRDDVQRWIAENWGHSPLAVKALTQWAQVRQIEVHYGDSLGKEVTRKQLGPETERKIICYSRLETTEMLEGRASDKLTNVVLNTPERWKRSREFDYLFAHGVYMSPDYTDEEACGFNTEAFAAQEGKQTISSQLIAEATERGKQEERKELEKLKRETKEAEEELKALTERK